MKGQHDTGKADEFAAEAHELLSQRDGQDTADYAAAVAAAIKAASAGRERPEIPPSWIVPRDCPSPGCRASARCPDPSPAKPGRPLAGLPSALKPCAFTRRPGHPPAGEGEAGAASVAVGGACRPAAAQGAPARRRAPGAPCPRCGAPQRFAPS